MVEVSGNHIVVKISDNSSETHLCLLSQEDFFRRADNSVLPSALKSSVDVSGVFIVQAVVDHLTLALERVKAVPPTHLHAERFTISALVPADGCIFPENVDAYMNEETATVISEVAGRVSPAFSADGSEDITMDNIDMSLSDSRQTSQDNTNRPPQEQCPVNREIPLFVPPLPVCNQNNISYVPDMNLSVSDSDIDSTDSSSTNSTLISKFNVCDSVIFSEGSTNANTFPDSTEEKNEHHESKVQISEQRSVVCSQSWTPTYKCDFCNETFPRKRLFMEHKRTHKTSKSNYVCDTCDRAFVYESSFTKHVNKHKEKPFVKRDKRKLSVEPTRSVENLKAEGVQCEKKQHVCETCSAVFGTRQKLSLHQRKHSKVSSCKKCRKLFSSLEELTQHISLCNFRSLCTTCGKTFSQKSYLKTHERIHTGERPYACELCPSAFKTTHALTRHMLAHTLEKPFICETCGKRFSKKLSMERHDQVAHKGIKKFVCKFCEKAFAHRQGLEGHERTHTMEKPYVCATCGWAFNYKSALMFHERTHTGEKRYVCQFCGWKFTKKYPLDYHLKAKHKDKL